MIPRPLIVAVSIQLLIQTITAQCIPSLTSCPVSLAFAPELPSGGSFAVRSTSPISPTGVAVLADQLVIEGPLTVDGQLPFLGTVVIEGAVASIGAGTVTHSCGGAVGMISELPAATRGLPLIGHAPIAPAEMSALVRGLAPIGRAPIGPPAPFGLGRAGVPPLGLGTGCGRMF